MGKYGFILKLSGKFGKSVTGARKFIKKIDPADKLKSLNKAMKKGAKAGMDKFKSLRQRMFRNMKPGFLKCKILRAEPVDCVTGEVIVEDTDYSIQGRMPIVWNRYYSSHGERIGVCGRGWETPADARLEFVDDNTVIFHDGTGIPTYFYALLEEKPVYEPVDGGMLQKVKDHYTVRTKADLIYCFPVPQKLEKQVLIEYITDLCGNTSHYVRDKNGLKEIIESGGKRIAVVSKNGLIEAMNLVAPYRDPQLLIKYEYDKSANLITVYDALNSPYKYSYRNNLLVQLTHRDGLSFYYEYDKYSRDGRCIHSWGDGGLYDYRFVYREEDRITEVTDSLGNTSYIKYDERYMITEDTNPLGGTTCYEYDEVGRTISVTDPDGNRTGYEYDRRGNMVKLTRPDGISVTTEFKENKPVGITNPNGTLWQLEWDSRGLLTRQLSPLGAESKYKYDDHGQPIMFIDPSGAVTTLTFDDYGNLTALTNALGHTTKFTYDMRGNINSRTDPMGRRSSYEYDLKGRLVKAILTGGAAIACAYDAEDNLISFRDKNGAETRLEYCGMGEVKRRIQPDGSIVEYHYDTEEQLIAITNQRGERYDLKRDALGRIVSEVDYWGQERKYTYSAAGHLLESIDPLGRLVSYKTDPLGRILQKYLPDPTQQGKLQTEAFSYDANGNLVSCENSNIRVEWDYDIDGRMVEERQGDRFIISNTYNLNGERISRVSQVKNGKETYSNTVNYSFDALGQATAVEILGYTPFQFTRNALGQITNEVLSSSLKRAFDYSPEGYLTAQKVLTAEGPAFEQRYDYDRAGNLIFKKDSFFGTDQFKYDPMGRITSHTNPEGKIQKYLHDNAGDLLTTKVVSESESEWRREGKFEDVQYSFDRAGNLNERGKTRFVWDANQRLIESTTDGKRTTYCYDPLGRRISKETDGISTYFYWDGNVLLGDVKSKCASHREWIYYPYSFEPLAMLHGQELYLYHNDINGCPTRLLDTDGKVVWAARYNVLGKIEKLPVNQVDNPLRMQGQYFDEETGLYYNRYRYFDPDICAFVSQDPLGLAAGENVYSYAPNVWSWIDPLGLHKKGKSIPGVGNGAKGTKDIKVIGRLEDTAVAKDWKGHDVLNDPNWTLAKNDEWVNAGIKNKQDFYIASPMTEKNLVSTNPKYPGPTVYAREIDMLKKAGYVQQGDYFIHPSNIK